MSNILFGWEENVGKEKEILYIWISNVLLNFLNIWTLFGYGENHKMVNFHLFSPEFLLLKTMFYFIFFNGKSWVKFKYIIFELNGIEWVFR